MEVEFLVFEKSIWFSKWILNFFLIFILRYLNIGQTFPACTSAKIDPNGKPLEIHPIYAPQVCIKPEIWTI